MAVLTISGPTWLVVCASKSCVSAVELDATAVHSSSVLRIMPPCFLAFLTVSDEEPSITVFMPPVFAAHFERFRRGVQYRCVNAAHVADLTIFNRFRRGAQHYYVNVARVLLTVLTVSDEESSIACVIAACVCVADRFGRFRTGANHHGVNAARVSSTIMTVSDEEPSITA